MKDLVHGGDIYTERNVSRIVDFSANINPLGLPSSVKQAIIDNIDKYSNYPDPLCRELRKAIAKNEYVDFNNVFCGNGAADIIFKISLALKPQKALLFSPTFAEYEESLKVAGCSIKYYELLEKNKFHIQDDVCDYITSDLDIMFLCNPNNPTGVPLENAKVLKILEKCKENNVVLVVDECFVDFLEDEDKYSVSRFIEKYDNLIILKAFTKIYAMAGLRLGYMITSNIDIIDKISRIGQPWSVSTVAAKCGIAALNEVCYITKSKRYIKKNREYLMSELRKLNFKVFDSKANYIFFKSKNRNLKAELEDYGILIRSCSNYRNLDDRYFRIAVKSTEDNKYFISTLKKLRGDDSLWGDNVNY